MSKQAPILIKLENRIQEIVEANDVSNKQHAQAQTCKVANQLVKENNLDQDSTVKNADIMVFRSKWFAQLWQEKLDHGSRH